MTIYREDNGRSFSLTKKTPVGRQKEGLDNSPLSWQEQAYDRLKVLYGVSKLLSSVYSVQAAFPQILNLCASSFPFVTGILIEKRGSKTNTAMWHADNVTKEQIDQAAKNAKRSFAYLTGLSKIESLELRDRKTPSDLLSGVSAKDKAETTNVRNYISIPLMVDGLPAFGTLQLDGSTPLNEKDLEFVDALASLVAVAVDRNFKTEFESSARKLEVSETSTKLTRAQSNVSDLETERELREKFVSMLTHDLRTPLSAARISAQLIQRQVDISATSQSLAARIVLNISRADQMISDLLDANRIRSGEPLQLHLELFDLGALVQATIEELATMYGDRFVFSCADKIEGYWDRRYIRRMIENLTTNAIKYGEPHSNITLMLRQIDETVFLEVHNDGEPITTVDQKTLFQQFHRSRKAHGSKKNGWGIGLTLVRGVVEAHGGTVSLRSELELGTIFTVSLPIDSRKIASGEDE